MTDVKEYMNTAAGIKKYIEQQSFMGLGIFHLPNARRAALYWFLAIVVFLPEAMHAWIKDFPSVVEKPVEVCWYDFGSRLIELLMVFAHGVVVPGNGWLVQLVAAWSGLTGLFWSE